MMAVENKVFEIQVNELAAVLLNARHLTFEISELIYNAKHQEDAE